MNTRGKIFRTGALLTGNRIASQVLRLIRSAIIARILSPADFGLAATFWITTSFLEMISEIGIQQRLIQTKDGDDDRVCAVAQTLFFLRGLMSAATLFAFAYPIARLFNAPEATWAFRLLALIPLISGLHHRDVDRMKRQLRFGPQVITGLAGDVIATIAAVPIALAVRNYTAFLYVGILNTVVSVVLTHVVAERPFRMGWDRRIVREFTSFGWPLMINSLLMYMTMQGDRIILARSYTKEELGVYSVAIGMVMAASGMLTGIVGPLQLPLLASVQDDRPRFERHMHLQAILMSAACMIFGAVFLTLGPAMILLVYGPKYRLASIVVGWIGLTKAIQMMRTVPSTAAMALGDTRNSMYTNMVRQSGIGLAVLVAWRGWGLEWIAISQFLGEVLAYIAVLPILRFRHGLPQAICWRPAAFVGAGFTVALVVTRLQGTAPSWGVSVIVFVVLSLLFVASYRIAFPIFGRELSFFWESVQRRLGRAST